MNSWKPSRLAVILAYVAALAAIMATTLFVGLIMRVYFDSMVVGVIAGVFTGLICIYPFVAELDEREDRKAPGTGG